tara:strand:+ start:134 stop:1150 length:1017 start_codon:yes stop_codon:yes gene_type:complete
MVREKLEKLDTKQLRKYITEHNKVVRKYIGEEIKQARVEYNQQLKVKRREMRAAKTLDPRGKKKPELINLIMSEPLLVKRLKSELEEKKKEKVIKIKRKPKVPKITITEAEEEPDVGGAAEPKSRLGPIPKPNVRIRVRRPDPVTDDEDEEEEEEKYDRKKVKVIKEIKTNKSGWLDYLELLADGEDDMGLYSPSIQQRYYKGLITRESNFVKRVKKNEKGKGTAKEQKERTVKNNNILNIVKEEVRNQPNIRKLFIELNPEIMKRLKKKVKEDDEKEAKEKKEKQSEQDKFILGNIKFFEDELKEVKKRKQNPSTKEMIEELEERIADEKAKLSKNK